MAGAAYEPLAAMDAPMDSASMMQNAYPAGAEMSTFGGNEPFSGAPPAYGGMAAMETSGLTKGPGETHGGHGEHEAHQTIKEDTGEAPRRCTDVQTCFCFLIYLIVVVTMLIIAGQHGNTARLTHGIDYYGRVCGVDPGVENMPFLYWCRKDATSVAVPTDLELTMPSCVPYCPASLDNAVQIPCLRPAVHQRSELPGPQFGNERTMQITMQESVVQTKPYPTFARGGRYCMPTDVTLGDKVRNGPLAPFSTLHAFNLVGTLRHVYWLMLVATVLAILLGYFYVFSIHHCPYKLAACFLFPPGFLCFAFGVCMFCSIGCLVDATGGFCIGYKEKGIIGMANPVYMQYDDQKASYISLAVGVVLLALSGFLIATSMNFKSVGITDLVRASMECFRSVPGLYYVPIFEAIAKFLVFWTGLHGFGVIYSQGNIEKNRIHVNGAKFAGLSRDFHASLSLNNFDIRFWVMALVYIYFFMWMMEICTATGQFVTSYCTFKYYGIKKEKGKKGMAPSGTVLQGLKMALIYHPGSVLQAAFIVPLPGRLIRLLQWCSWEIARGNTETSGAAVINCLKSICLCGLTGICEKAYEWSSEKLEDASFPLKDGLTDVVIRANDFGKGSEQAHFMLEHSHKIIKYIYLKDITQTTVNLIGVFSVASTSSLFVYLLVANLDIYKEPTSDLYISDPCVVAFLTWILCAHIAFGFMTLWDHTADSLLFCYAWSRRWNRKVVDKYVPDTLVHIVGFDHKDNDRYPYYGKARNNMYLRYWLPMVGMEDPKKQKVDDRQPMVAPMETNAPLPGTGIGRRPASQDRSWMGGFGTNWMQPNEEQPLLDA